MGNCRRYTFLFPAVVKSFFISFRLFIKIKNVGNIIIIETENDLSNFCFDARQSIHPLQYLQTENDLSNFCFDARQSIHPLQYLQTFFNHWQNILYFLLGWVGTLQKL